MITARENIQEGLRSTFKYKENRLTDIDCYLDGFLYSSSSITHTGDKISAITTSIYRLQASSGAAAPQCGLDALNAGLTRNLRISKSGISTFHIPHSALSFAPYAAHCVRSGGVVPTGTQKSAGDVIYTEALAITWDGDNIKEVTSTAGDGTECRWSYSYDSKSNPYCNFWTKEGIEADLLAMMGSRNNVLSSLMYRNGVLVEEYSYSYRYDGAYPVCVVRTDNNTSDAAYLRQEIITTEYNYH